MPDNEDPRNDIRAGRRLGVLRSEWLDEWWISHSPRNDNQNAEGPWEEWVTLAHMILAADASHRGPTLDDQGRIIIGTTYLAPSGDIYRLRGYGADWSAEPFTGEQTLPDYSVQWVGGMSSVARSIPEGSVIIWAPRPMRVGDRVVHRNLDVDRSVVYGHVTRVRDDELMTEIKWADGSGPTWHRTFDLQHAEEAS